MDDKEKIVFSIIGSIEERKGHDILFDALSYLPANVLSRIELNVVGRTLNPAYAKMIREKIKGLNFINFTGEVSNAESIRYLSTADVLVCPSRDDPFPVILVEAFCMAKTCIVSDNTGFAELIKQGENGYVFRNEDSRQLAEIIENITLNAESLEHTGTKARDSYKEFLTMEILEYRLMKYIRSIGNDQENQTGTTVIKASVRQPRKEIVNNV
jgi:glycosyltransferase involved in cell wall biosynthesis